MAKIFNYTPHSISIITNSMFNPDIRKYVVAPANFEVAMSIPSSGMLNAKITTEEGDTINGVPTFVKRVVGCDPLPDEVGDDDIIVVSALYASAYRKTYGDDTRLYTVADPVYNAEDPRQILGSRGICPAF